MTHTSTDVAAARTFTYLIFTLAGFLFGTCIMSIYDHAKVEQDRAYYSTQKFEQKVDAERECSNRLTQALMKCKCAVEVK